MMKVLVIDDIKDNLTVLKAVIREAFPEAAVYSALNGKDGIELASTIDPDVILLDIIMPGMDGFEVCRRLKKNEKLKHIPVVFLTALKTSAENRIKALEAGGDGFLSKPVDQQELIAQLRAMKKIKMAAQCEKQEKIELEAMVAERTKALEDEIKLRIQTEQQLRESEEKYRFISNLTSDYIFQANVNGDGTSEKSWVAGSFEQITGYTFEEYINRGGWLKMIHPDDIAKNNKAYEKLKKNQKVSLDLRIIHKSGKIIWVRSSGFPIWDKQKNRLTGIIGAVKDITEEKIHRQLQEILFGVTKKVLTETNLHNLFAAVQQELNKVMDAKNFMVVEWNETKQTFTAKYGKDEKKLITNYPAKGTLSIRVINSRKPVFLLKKEILSLAEKEKTPVMGTVPEIWMGVPLFRNEQIYGLMMVQHYQNPQAYDKLSLQIFEAVANELSLYLSRKETEEENARLSMAIQQSLIATLITDPEGDIQFVNPAFCQITGYSREELIGQNAHMLKPDTFPITFFEEIKKTIKEGRVWQGEIYNKKKNGDAYYVDAIISPLFDDEKHIIQVVTSLEDITERKRNRQFQEIQFNIAHSMVTSPTIHDLFLTVKKELNKIIYANNLFIALYDLKTNNLTTQFGDDEKEFVRNIPPEKSLSGKVMKAGKALLFTKKEIRKLADKGEIILIGERAEVWLGAPLTVKNKPMGVIAVQSYTNPKAYDEKAKEIMGIIANQLSLYIEEKRTKEFNLKLSKATEQSPIIIQITNIAGTIEYVNPKFTEITGYTTDEVIGQNPRILKSGEHSKAFYQKLWDTVLSGKEWKGEFHNKKKNGELFWESALISPIYNDSGEITHLLAVKEDITEKKKILSELIRAKEKAEESDRLKTAFLQNMSHEIRTPLNGILGFADLLAYENISADQTRTYAHYILSSGNRLLKLINNILDISRIESGSFSLQTNPFMVNNLIKEAWQLFKLQADKNKIRFTYHLSLEDKESIIVSDETRVNQIIVNLLSNAFKFTPTGSIDFGYKVQEKTLLFWVKDTGKGIAPEHQKRIFERFYQADMSISRDYEGAGLGLSISKGLVELLGGKMWLESQVGAGTTFYFTLPYNGTKKMPIHTSKSKTSIMQKNSRPVILVVEDDETSFLYLKTVLTLEKLEVLHASSGSEAIEMCRLHPEISLVLMDIKLPEMNGLEAVRKIREFRPDLPVVAQTAHAFSSDRQEALNAGCNDFITKPIPKNKLLEITAKYVK